MTLSRNQRAEVEAERAETRAERRAAIRGDILRIAAQMIEEHGYKRTRMRELARRAQVSYQTLYNHFPAKSLILAALLNSELEETADPHVRLLPPALTALMPASAAPAQRIPPGAGNEDYCVLMRDTVEKAFDAASSPASPHPRQLWREVLLDQLQQRSEDFCAFRLLHAGGPEAVFRAARSTYARGRLNPPGTVEAMARLLCLVIDANLTAYLLQPALSRREALQLLSEQLDAILRPYLHEDAPAASQVQWRN